MKNIKVNNKENKATTMDILMASLMSNLERVLLTGLSSKNVGGVILSNLKLTFQS